VVVDDSSAAAAPASVTPPPDGANGKDAHAVTGVTSTPEATEVAVTVTVDEVVVVVNKPTTTSEATAAEHLTEAIRIGAEKHLSLVTYLMCKTCKAMAQVVPPEQWVPQAEGSGRFNVNLSACASCRLLNSIWSDAVCP
jgi:hypothetical protein